MIINLRKTLITGASTLLVICVFSLPSSGQANAAAPKTFSLEDALNYALQNYPAVRASLEQVNAAKAGVSLARSQYLPILDGVYQWDSPHNESLTGASNTP